MFAFRNEDPPRTIFDRLRRRTSLLPARTVDMRSQRRESVAMGDGPGNADLGRYVSRLPGRFATLAVVPPFEFELLGKHL